MRNILTHNLLASLLGAVGAAIALPTPVFASPCPPVPSVPASAELRAFRSPVLGLTLGIPANYRSVLRSSGHITFHDPSSFTRIQCLVRTGRYGALPPHTALEVYPGVAPEADLLQTVRQKRPWVDYYSPDYASIEIAGYPALQYEYIHEIHQMPISNISFLSQDGQTLITLSGPAQHPILENALATLEILPVLP